MRLLIGADIVPTSANERLFEKGDVSELLGEDLERLLSEADYIIMNLETPVTDDITPIYKAGENLVARKATFRGLKEINPYFFGLANNHIMDQGEQGLYSTIDLLEANNIGWCGAGKSLTETKKTYLKTVEGVRIGIYACAEHEYSIADYNRPGANPYDPLYSFEHVKELREECDLCIVLYHGGRELYRYPSPNLQRVFRRFAEVGADIVVAQHTHCIGCTEEYNNSKLIYGQGDFLFDHSMDDKTRTSLVIQIDTDGSNHMVSYIPIKRINGVVRVADNKENKEILKGFNDRSEQIKEPGVIRKRFNDLSSEQKHIYLTGILGRLGRVLPIRLINRISGYTLSDLNYRGKTMLPLDDFIRCETHIEILKAICDAEVRKHETE